MKPLRLPVVFAVLMLILAANAFAQIPKGSIAPDFTLKDLSGNAVCLSSLRGRVVLLEFFATW